MGKFRNLWAAATSSGSLFSKIFLTGSYTGEIPDPQDFQKLAYEGFENNPLVYACIKTIAKSVAEPQIMAVTVDPLSNLTITNSAYSGDPLGKLLIKPNHYQDQYEFFEQMLVYLYISGNAFIRKVRSELGGPPLELELVRPDLMKIIPGANRFEGKVREYIVESHGARYSVPKEDIIHLRLPGSLNDYWGLSPVYVAYRLIQVDTKAADFLRAFFENKGIPAGILSLEGTVPREERERVKEAWVEQTLPGQNWHGTAVLDNRADYKPLQSGIEKMDLSAVTAQTETRICSIFGIPPSIIATAFGLSRSTFSNLAESREIFWIDTLSPMYARIQRKLTLELATEFGENRQVVFDLSQVTALQENKSETRKIALQGWDNGLLTRGQADSLLGLSNDQGGEKDVKLQSGAQFIQIGSSGISDTKEQKVDDVAPTIVE